MFWMQYAFASKFMPTAATDQASQVNNLYSFLLISSFIACVILIGGMIYFAYKYKRQSLTAKSAYITHNTFLEFLWSFIPLVIFLVVFGWGWHIYHQMRQFPKDALEVHVTGKQWAWEATYKSGVRTANLVKVPIDTDVKIILASNDVIHSFYVPSFRIKQDAVPGRYTAVWFNANKLGDFHIFCTEYCGTQHSGMIGKLQVVSREEYDKWLEEEAKFSTLPIAQKGEKLFQIKACSGCHSVADASVKVGPSLFKKFGAKEELTSGDSTGVDENYLRESILNPNAKIVKGFASGVMPSFQGQLSEDELSAIIEYIKSAK
ncbi:MAG: cytochrome c oxidase subunit II [Bdellovibrionaceae bacterium]|nr:cytochrome c oxidase subunit II [Pseudobdellovibrionaceae bacterium]NUM59682.1 cytochrome c oxidase subunit II [Pseudobdellovibrionaceae bacterium]